METTVWLGLNFGAWIAIVTILCMFLTLDFTKLLAVLMDLIMLTVNLLIVNLIYPL